MEAGNGVNLSSLGGFVEDSEMMIEEELSLVLLPRLRLSLPRLLRYQSLSEDEHEGR